MQETTTRNRIAEAELSQHRQLLGIAGLPDADIRSLEKTNVLQEVLRIRAPFSGVVTDRMAITGQRLDAMSPVYRLADLSELWLEINVPQEQVAAIQPDTRVTVVGPYDNYSAVVKSIGRAVDPATQIVTVRAILEGNAQALNPGQFVAVRIADATPRIAERDNWAVPVTAVARSGESVFVFVKSESGVELRQVVIIGVSSDRVHITASLEPDDLLAVDGISALKAIWAATAGTGS
jgi:cobalt-zinc-cadmium efflux system membrane fusion protein